MKNLIIVIVAVSLTSFGMYYFATSGSSDTRGSALVPSSPAGGNTTAFSGRDFLRTLANIQSLKLDDKLFGSPVFLSFTDFSVPLVPQPKGRSNPFQPIGME